MRTVKFFKVDWFMWFWVLKGYEHETSGCYESHWFKWTARRCAEKMFGKGKWQEWKA